MPSSSFRFPRSSTAIIYNKSCDWRNADYKVRTTNLDTYELNLFRSTGQSQCETGADAEWLELISETGTAAQRKLKSIEERSVQLETKQNETVNNIPKEHESGMEFSWNKARINCLIRTSDCAKKGLCTWLI